MWRTNVIVEVLVGAVLIVVCLLCEGFFSGTETAIVSIDRNRMQARAAQGCRRAAMLSDALSNPERFFSTTLLGTNMVVVFSNAVATMLVIRHLGQQYEYLTIAIMSPIILVFGEIVPKTVCRHHAELLAPYFIRPISIIAGMLSPLVHLLTNLTALLVRALGLGEARFQPHTTREDLANYLEMWSLDSTLKSAERKIIERIFDFSETRVGDIMIRLVNISALEAGDSIEDALRLARKTGYSRIPVYAEEAYNIIGIVHARDLLSAGLQHLSLRDIMRSARYVPDTAPIDDLLVRMRTEGNSIAVVVNEYGGTIGIVTIEDILEEVVGEIYDEYDKKENLITPTGKNSYLVKARTEIGEVNEALGLDIPRDDYETLGGFLLKHFGHIPRLGEKLQWERATFIVRQADKRAIRDVTIVLPKPGAPAKKPRAQ